MVDIRLLKTLNSFKTLIYHLIFTEENGAVATFIFFRVENEKWKYPYIDLGIRTIFAKSMTIGQGVWM